MSKAVETILVSSHPDDVALSIGGSILSGYFRRPFLLVSAFSYGGWAPYLSGKHDKEIIFRQRTGEDVGYAKAIGSDLIQLGQRDAALECMFGADFNFQRWLASIIRGRVIRGEKKINWLENGLGNLTQFKVPRVIRWSVMEKMARFDRVYGELENKLNTIASRFPDATLVSPLAIGLHPDHVLVARACKGLSKKMRTCYYEDLPYARDYPLSSIGHHLARFDPCLRPSLVDIEGVLNEKVEVLRLYESQLGPRDFDKVLSHAKRVDAGGRACERIWMAGGSRRGSPP